MIKSIDFFEKTHLSELVPLVAFLVPEMNESVIQYYLRISAKMFARRSRILRRTIEIETYDNTCDYYLPLPDEYTVFRICEVKLNGCCIDCAGNCECCPGHYRYHQGCLTLCDPICASDCLEVEAIVIPTDKSCEIDNEIVDNWPEAIIEAFKSIVYSGNDKRWKNMTQSNISLREFKRLADEAQDEYKMGNISKKIVRICR